jgi:hypothetical protein
MSYDNSNTGSLNFAEDKRSDRSPDMWGSLQCSGDVLEALKAGKRIRLTGWKRDGRNGQFISLKAEVERDRANPQKQGRDQVPGQYDMKAAEALAKTQTPEQRAAAITEDFDDAIPF